MTDRPNSNPNPEKNPWGLTIRLLNILLILAIAGIVVFVGLWFVGIYGMNAKG